jgi:hypothetical protein
MTTIQNRSNVRPQKRTRTISIKFERQSLELPVDEDLVQFVQQIEPNTAKEDDIHVMHAYFQIYWPFKTNYYQENGKTKSENVPQVFRGYRINS